MEPMVITPMPLNTIRPRIIDRFGSLDFNSSILLLASIVSRFYFPFLNFENWMLKLLIIWFFSFKFRVTNVNEYLGWNAIYLSNFLSDNIVSNYWYCNSVIWVMRWSPTWVQPSISVLRMSKLCLATQSIIINKTNKWVWNRIRFIFTDSNWRSWCNNRRD